MYIVSACLCGVDCKYSGKNNLNEKCLKLFKEGRAILVCPEQLGGLPTPRNPVELQGTASEIIENGNGKAISNSGEDCTEKFIKGAYETLKIARTIGIDRAILKEGSPSCGCNLVYDGTFTNNKIEGKGITAYLLEKEGMTVFSDEDIEDNHDKLVYLDKFDREKAKKRKLFKQIEEEEEYFEEEYYDLTDSLSESGELPPTVEKNVRRLMVSLAKDLMGFEDVEEISEATGIDVEDIKKLIKDTEDDNE
ncbi:MAG: DUF523 domain-containing protein [Clostridium butyricum]|nr:DUF523 domain-containing protein [Clostridium butyricum]